jgi:hypothetical protein
MPTERLYIASRKFFPTVFEFLLPARLVQEFIVEFFQKMRFYGPNIRKSLTIIEVKEDEGCQSMVFNVSIQGNDLIQFSQWVESFCRDKGIHLCDLWNYLKLNK